MGASSVARVAIVKKDGSVEKWEVLFHFFLDAHAIALHDGHHVIRRSDENVPVANSPAVERFYFASVLSGCDDGSEIGHALHDLGSYGRIIAIYDDLKHDRASRHVPIRLEHSQGLFRPLSRWNADK
jgi:hypothetical protein